MANICPGGRWRLWGTVSLTLFAQESPPLSSLALGCHECPCVRSEHILTMLDQQQWPEFWVDNQTQGFPQHQDCLAVRSTQDWG